MNYEFISNKKKITKFSPKRSFSSYIKSLKILKPLLPPMTLTDSEKPTTAEEKAAKSQQQQQQPEEEKQ